MNKKNIPIYIALGANLSNPKDTFAQVLSEMPDIGINVLAVSGLWQSPAWPPGSDQPDYINAAACVEFEGGARDLLACLHQLEEKHGRVRGVKNAARNLDLDLLDFRGQIIQSGAIHIPHPRMLSRGFVLFPLQEIAPQWRDPVADIWLLDHIARLPLDTVTPITYLGAL